MKNDSGANVVSCAELSPPAAEYSAALPDRLGAAAPLRLLVVQPDAGRRAALGTVLDGEAELCLAAAGAEALALAALQQPHVVLLEPVLPDMDGLRLLASLRDLAPRAVVVVLTAQPSMETALAVLEMGAYAYLTWPQRSAALRSTVVGARNLGELLAGRNCAVTMNPEDPRLYSPLAA